MVNVVRVVEQITFLWPNTVKKLYGVFPFEFSNKHIAALIHQKIDTDEYVLSQTQDNVMKKLKELHNDENDILGIRTEFDILPKNIVSIYESKDYNEEEFFMVFLVRDVVLECSNEYEIVSEPNLIESIRLLNDKFSDVTIEPNPKSLPASSPTVD